MHCSESKTKQNSKHFEQQFSVNTNEEQTCLSELLLVSETSTTSSTTKFSARMGSAVFIFVNNKCEIDLSGNRSWKIHTKNLL